MAVIHQKYSLSRRPRVHRFSVEFRGTRLESLFPSRSLYGLPIIFPPFSFQQHETKKNYFEYVDIISISLVRQSLFHRLSSYDAIWKAFLPYHGRGKADPFNINLHSLTISVFLFKH